MARRRDDHHAAVAKEIEAFVEPKMGRAVEPVHAIGVGPDASSQGRHDMPAVDKVELRLADPHGNTGKILQAADVIPMSVRQDHTLQGLQRKTSFPELRSDRSLLFYSSRLL